MLYMYSGIISSLPVYCALFNVIENLKYQTNWLSYNIFNLKNKMGPYSTWLIYRYKYINFNCKWIFQGKRKRKQADEDSISIQSYDPNKSKVGIQPFWIFNKLFMQLV